MRRQAQAPRAGAGATGGGTQQLTPDRDAARRPVVGPRHGAKPGMGRPGLPAQPKRTSRALSWDSEDSHGAGTAKTFENIQGMSQSVAPGRGQDDAQRGLQGRNFEWGYSTRRDLEDGEDHFEVQNRHHVQSNRQDLRQSRPQDTFEGATRDIGTPSSRKTPSTPDPQDLQEAASDLQEVLQLYEQLLDTTRENGDALDLPRDTFEHLRLDQEALVAILRQRIRRAQAHAMGQDPTEEKNLPLRIAGEALVQDLVIDGLERFMRERDMRDPLRKRDIMRLRYQLSQVRKDRDKIVAVMIKREQVDISAYSRARAIMLNTVREYLDPPDTRPEVEETSWDRLRQPTMHYATLGNGPSKIGEPRQIAHEEAPNRLQQVRERLRQARERKSQILEERQQQQSLYHSRVQDPSRELDRLREANAELVTQLRAAQKQNSEKSSRIEKLERDLQQQSILHRRVLKDMETMYEAKIEHAIVEHQGALEDVQRAQKLLQSEREQHTRSLADARSHVFQQARAEAQQQFKQWKEVSEGAWKQQNAILMSQAVSKAKSELESKSLESTQGAKEELAKATARNEILISEVRELQQRVDQAQQLTTTLETQMNELRKSLKLEQEVSAKQAIAADTARKSLAEYQAKWEEAQIQQEKLQEDAFEAAEALARAQTRERDLSWKLEQAQSSSQDHSTSIADLQRRIEALQQDRNSIQTDLVTSQRRAAYLEGVLDQVKQDAAEELSEKDLFVSNFRTQMESEQHEIRAKLDIALSSHDRKVKHLELELEKAQAEVAHTYESWSTKFANSDAQVSALRNELNQVRAQVLDKTQIADAAERRVSSLEAELASLQSAQQDATSSQLQSAAAAHAQLIGTNERLQSELAAAREELAHMHSQMAEAESKCARAEMERAQALNKLDLVKQDLEAATLRIQAHEDTANEAAKVQSALEAIQTQLDTALTQLETTEAALEGERMHSASLDAQLNEQVEDYASLCTEHDSVTQRMEELVGNHSSLQREVEDVKSRNKALQFELEHALETQARSVEALHQAQATSIVTTEDKEQHRIELAQLEEKHRTELERHREELDQQANILSAVREERQTLLAQLQDSQQHQVVLQETCTELKATIQTLETRINDISQELDNQRQAEDHQEAQAQALALMRDQHQHEKEALQKKLGEQSETLHLYDQERHELEEKLKRADDMREDAYKQSDNLLTTVKDLETRIENMTKEIQAKHAENSAHMLPLQEERDKLSDDVHSLQEQLRETQSYSMAMKDQLTELRKELEVEKAKYAEALEENEQDARSLRDQLGDLFAERDAMQDEFSAKKAELQSLVQSLEKQCEALADQKPQQINSNESSLKATEHRVAELERKIKEQEEIETALRKQLHELHEKHQALENDRDALLQERDITQRECTNVQDRLHDLTTQHETLCSELEQAHEALQNAQSRSLELEATCADLEARLTEEKSANLETLHARDNQITELETQHSTIRDTFTAEVENLQTIVGQLRQERDSLLSRLDEDRTAHSNQNEEIAHAQSATASAEAKIITLEATIADLESRLAEHERARTMNTNGLINEETESVESLQRQVDELFAERDMMQDEFAVEIQNVQSELDKRTMELERLRATSNERVDLDSIEKKHSQQLEQALAEEREAANRAAQMTIDAFREMAEESKEDLTEAKEQIKSLKVEVKELRNELEIAKAASSADPKLLENMRRAKAQDDGTPILMTKAKTEALHRLLKTLTAMLHDAGRQSKKQREVIGVVEKFLKNRPAALVGNGANGSSESDFSLEMELQALRMEKQVLVQAIKRLHGESAKSITSSKSASASAKKLSSSTARLYQLHGPDFSRGFALPKLGKLPVKPSTAPSSGAMRRSTPSPSPPTPSINSAQDSELAPSYPLTNSAPGIFSGASPQTLLVNQSGQEIVNSPLSSALTVSTGHELSSVEEEEQVSSTPPALFSSTVSPIQSGALQDIDLSEVPSVDQVAVDSLTPPDIADHFLYAEDLNNSRPVTASHSMDTPVHVSELESTPNASSSNLHKEEPDRGDQKPPTPTLEDAMAWV